MTGPVFYPDQAVTTAAPPDGAVGIRALTLWQPWAGAIAYGAKRVENRTWPVPSGLIGQVIAIHAGQRFDHGARLCGRPAPRQAPPELLRRGAVLAVAQLASCHFPGRRPGACGHAGLLCSRWAARGEYHWVLRQVQPLPEPVPARGFQGLWRLPREVEQAIHAQLPMLRRSPAGRQQARVPQSAGRQAGDDG